MNTEFLPEADEEFREANRYYQKEASGVGLFSENKVKVHG